MIATGIWFQGDRHWGKTANAQDIEFSAVLWMLDSLFP
jgi:hypothetical protein